MKKYNLSIIVIFILSSLSLSAKEQDGHWDLTPIYPNAEAWKKDLKQIEQATVEIPSCKGHLGDSAEVLKKCLDKYFNTSMKLSRAGVWASLQKAVDNKSSKFAEYVQIVDNLESKFGQATAFYSPDISKIERKKLETWIGQTAGLQDYSHYLRKTMDLAPHLLDEKRSALVSALWPTLSSPAETQNLLMNADLTWPEIKLADGTKAKINVVGYEKYRKSANREDRMAVFNAFYPFLTTVQRTLGATLATTVQRNVAMAKERNYKTALESAISGNQIPESVYRMLIKQVNNGLGTLHKYWALKKKILKLKQLDYADAYAPVLETNTQFPLDKTKELVLEALSPLGVDYIEKIKSAFSNNWMDIYPQEGKRSGAFMDPSAYQVHPYVFLNYTGNFDSVSTFAHEWGHAMHSVYSNSNQSFANADYPTFLAEIASITNEVLLQDYMTKNAKTKEEKIYYLEGLVHQIRTTFFRQAQFGEFELAIHEAVEKGEPLSGEKISKIYGEIARRYYGHSKGVMNIDEKYFSEWVYIHHFYSSFYVYQYATSMAAAFYFAENIINKKPNAVENYLKVLKAGGSDYPYVILQKAGVDMADAKVYQAVLKRMDKAIDELAKLQ